MVEIFKKEGTTQHKDESMSNLKVVISNPKDSIVYDEPLPVFMERLRKAVSVDCEISCPETSSEDELIRLVKNADVIVLAMGSRIPRKVLEAADNLKLVQTTGAGVDKMPPDSFDHLKENNIYLSNTSGANAIAVAEHALTLMLMLAKKAVLRYELLQRGEWERSKSIELYGKTVGIVGLGSIGVELAKRAKAFGMRIMATKRHPSPDFSKRLGIDFLGGPDDLPKILGESDFVVLSVPTTTETQGLIGERELRLMKKSGFIINVARGSVIREEALYKALKEKWIAGAGLDTWWGFVPDVPSKLGIHKLDNVVATSHIGGLTAEFLENLMKIVSQNIERISSGEEPLNLVNLDVKY